MSGFEAWPLRRGRFRATRVTDYALFYWSKKRLNYTSRTNRASSAVSTNDELLPFIQIKPSKPTVAA
jgi:hypothetical protein